MGLSFLNYRTFFPIIEITSDKKIVVPSNERPVLYKRGNPSDLCE